MKILSNKLKRYYFCSFCNKQYNLQIDDHHPKATPTAYPMAVMIAPRIKVSRPDLIVFRPIRAAFAKPKLNSSTTPMQTTAIHCWSSDLMIPAEMMQGMAGMPPKIIKETKVTTPFFLATSSSSTTSPNSQSIMILTKACLLVAQRSAILLESSRLNPLARQMSMISFFSSLSRLSTSYSSLYSSDLMYFISARAERQSPRPMPMPSPTMAQMQRMKIWLALVPEDTPLRMMSRVLMHPSSPPYTIDFKYSPASM